MKDKLHEFYCTPQTNQEGTNGTRYQIWERGEALGDSITPSVYCEPYRNHLTDKIVSLAGTGASVFSIGCGNAFVEGQLVKKGLTLEAIDFNEEAVELACTKGVKARGGNYYDLADGSFSSFDIIYADGLVGHLFKADNGLDCFFEKMKKLSPKKESWIVLSNDAPLQKEIEFKKNGDVKGFWLLSRDYLQDALERFGYSVEENYNFTYERPISGTRNRSICIAKV